jgi:maleate cis-trans isomerase
MEVLGGSGRRHNFVVLSRSRSENAAEAADCRLPVTFFSCQSTSIFEMGQRHRTVLKTEVLEIANAAV